MIGRFRVSGFRGLGIDFSSDIGGLPAFEGCWEVKPCAAATDLGLRVLGRRTLGLIMYGLKCGVSAIFSVLVVGFSRSA